MGTRGRKRDDETVIQLWVNWKATGFNPTLCPWKNPRQMKKIPVAVQKTIDG